MQQPQNHEDLLMQALETASHKLRTFINDIQEELLVAKNDAFFEAPEIKKKRQDQEFFNILHKNFILEMIHIEMVIKHNLEKRYDELLELEAKIKNENAQKSKEDKYFEELYLEEKNQSQRILIQQAENLKTYLELLDNHIKEINLLLAEILELKNHLKVDIVAQMEKLIYQYNACHIGISEIKEITLPPLSNIPEEKNIFKFDTLDLHHLLREKIAEKLRSGEINPNEINSAERIEINHFFEDRLSKHYEKIIPNDSPVKKQLWVNSTMASPRFNSIVEATTKQIHRSNHAIATEAAKLTALQQNLKNVENEERNCQTKLKEIMLERREGHKQEVSHTKIEKVKVNLGSWHLRSKNIVKQAEESNLCIKDGTQKASNVVAFRNQRGAK